MASYIELRELFLEADLKNRIDIAIIVAAKDLLDKATPTTEEQKWATAAAAAPRREAEKALMFVLAANKAATIEQIISATDEAIQTEVDKVIPALVIAHAG